jgi:nitrile hydratase beta subunit
MLATGEGLPPTPLDAFRHRLERLDPIKYLSSSYYERLLAGMESALVETGMLSLDEIETRLEQLTADPDVPMPRREDPASAEHLANAVRAGPPESQRKIRQKPRFAVGDKIVTRNLNPLGHTRLPRYVRGKSGVIVAHHGAHVFPDTNAHGLGENPQHLYTVRIAARELWGYGAEPNECVLIDLWDSYLERDKAVARSTARNTGPAAKKVVAKASAQAAKVLARAASAKRSLAAPLPSITPAQAGRGRKSKVGGAIAYTGRGSTSSKRRSGKPMRRTR